MVRALLNAKAIEDLRVILNHRSGVSGNEFARVEVVPPAGKALQLYWDAIALPRALRRLKPQLIHLTKPNGLLPARGLPPVVTTIYDVIPLTHPQTQTFAQRLYWRIQLKRAAQRADHILTISEYSKRSIMERLGVAPERITVTYPGIEPLFRPPADEQCHRVREKYSLARPYLLSVGTIEPRKNVDNFLRACARLMPSIPHDVVVAGRWGWKTEAVRRAAADPRLRGRLKFVGRVPDEDLPALYRSADLCVFLSSSEGFGFPVLEAVACGTAVIIHAGGSLPEIAGSAAVTIATLEESSVAGAIQSLLRDPAERERRTTEGMRHAATFTWERVALETLAVYRKLV